MRQSLTPEARARAALQTILALLDRDGYTWDKHEDDFREAIRTIVETALQEPETVIKPEGGRG